MREKQLLGEMEKASLANHLNTLDAMKTNDKKIKDANAEEYRNALAE